MDYGEKTLGISLSDESKVLASPMETIRYKTKEELFISIDKYFEKYKIDTIVLGNPINLDGTTSKRSEETFKFKSELEKKYNIPVLLEDERLTTVAAHKTMNFLDVNKNKKKNIVDTISAVYILETYLNKIKN